MLYLYVVTLAWNPFEGHAVQKPYRIVIAEDYTILREGLRALISADPEFDVVGEAEDGLSAIRCVEKFQPDLALMDLSMPKTNGIEAIHEIKKKSPQTKVLALTVHKAEEYVIETFRAGADGYVLKDATHNELMLAIKSVLGGKRYVSPGVSDKLIEGYLEGKKPFRAESSWDSLTPRERQILKLIAEGNKNKEIADYLCISIKTVEKHRSNLMRKIDLHNVSALTTYAMKKGLTTK